MAQLPSRKRRKISPPNESNPAPKAKPLDVDGYMANAARWNLEQDYENRPRKNKKKEKENTRLPIKTAQGIIEQVEAPLALAEASEAESELEELEASDSIVTKVQEPKKSSKEEIKEAKFELARIASLINEDPEENIGGMKTLAEFARSENATVKKLAIAAQAAIFKDIIPGYRIRPLDETSITEKVSKDVRKLRALEQGLVSAYQAYVKELAFNTAGNRNFPNNVHAASLATVSISCACMLLLAVPHFNFRNELIKIVVGKLSTRNLDADFEKCRTTIETLFREDEDGKPSQEAVATMSSMIKGRNYHVDESVINTFLHLRLLIEFSSKASRTSVDKHADEEHDGKKIKQKKVFRTKKQRKAMKELKAVEKEFREADATVSYEERERLQAETLKIVFVIYFRILKARSPSLMGAVLEGLAKYAHLINQDFFGDLLIALQEIASQAVFAMGEEQSLDESPKSDNSSILANPVRTALLCTTTAFALLSSQEAASLNLDLSYFTNLLYNLLLPLSTSPDLELSTKTMRLADPHDPSATDVLPNKVNATTLSTLLIRALNATLTPRNLPRTRVAAFAHRLMLLSVQVPEKTSLAITTLMREVMRIHGRKINGLWDSEERRGDGTFDPLGGIELSRPFCGTIWEGELLKLHYADGVRTGLGDLEAMVKGMAG